MQLKGLFGSHIGDLSVPELVFLDELHKVRHREENACERASASSSEEPCPLSLSDNLVYSESESVAEDDVLDDVYFLVSFDKLATKFCPIILMKREHVSYVKPTALWITP